MPTRIIREGVLNSETVNSLSERAELFYRRLMSVADDYGRYYSDPRILHCNVYSLRLDQVSVADVKQMLNECIAAKLVMIYGGGKYLEIQKFGQQTRAKSKFPNPSAKDLVNYSLIKCISTDIHLLIPVGVGVEGEGVEIDKGIKKFNDIEARLGDLFQRPEGSVSTYAEQSGISEISRRPDVMNELAEIEVFHRKPGNFFPQSLQKLLSTWQETLDRARTHDTRKENHATDKRTGEKRIDRSIGTANEGIAKKYAGMGRMVPPVPSR